MVQLFLFGTLPIIDSIILSLYILQKTLILIGSQFPLTPTYNLSCKRMQISYTEAVHLEQSI